MSKIEVDAITQQSGTTLTVGGGACKTATVDATTVTLGRSGGTVSLAAGATQSGFGRTGTVDWQTSSIKTATFTAANGEGYFANTSGGAFTMNLPAGTAGNIVSVVDYTNTFQTNNLTVAPNGAQKIGGIAADSVLSTQGQSVTLVYVDDTEGWKNVQDSTSNVTGNPFLIATGGTITCSGNCRIHTFTGPGTFTVSAAAVCAAQNVVSYLVIAGGGAAGTPSGSGGSGGGGAGGFREVKTPLTPYTASPLDGYPSAPNRVTVTAQAYPIQVGGGAPVTQPGPVAGACGAGVSGTPSIFSTITSAGGGGGGGKDTPGPGENGVAGGSGGGARYGPNTGGTGNTPPTSPAQGSNGGSTPSATRSAGGGGGAGAVGANGYPGSGYPTGSNPGGAGGAGVTTEITTSPVAYAGGGGGGVYAGTPGSGGTGGGGAAGNPGVNGTANTGGGGGGGSYPATGTGGAGGSGIVVIRYKYK